jgi:hypothetical protein
MQLIRWRLENPMTGRLEVATGNDFQSLANVDNQRSRLVRHVMPFLVVSPDLEARDWHRKEQSSQPEIGVAMHAETLGRLCGCLLDRTEESVTKVALTGGAAVRLYPIPEVVVGKLKHAGEQGEEAAVDGSREVLWSAYVDKTLESPPTSDLTHLTERLNLVHEWVKTGGDKVVILPLASVPVELLDSIGDATEALEPVRVLVARPAASFWIKQKAGLVLLTDVVV